MMDLGWANAGGVVEAKIDEARDKCRALGHTPTDVDHSNHRGTDHQVTCEACDYTYHYDSGD